MSSKLVLWLACAVVGMHPVAAHAQFSVENFRLPGGEVEHSSPTLADLNGDNIPEVLVGTKIQTPGRAVEQPPMLVVLRGNGSLLWARNVGAPVNSTPVVADIDSDGDPEVIVSTGGAVGDRNHHGSVSAYDHTGARLWSFYPEDDNGDDGKKDKDDGSDDGDCATPVPTPTASPVPAPDSKVIIKSNRINPVLGEKMTVSVRMDEAGRASVKIYNQMGELLKTLTDGRLPAGVHEFDWSGDNELGAIIGSGVFYIVVETPGGSFREKGVIVK